MKKTIKLKSLLLSLTFSPIMAVMACSTYTKKDADGYEIAMSLPGIKFANLGDGEIQDKYQNLSIKILMERLKQNPEIKNQYFAEITKKLMLSVLKTAHKDNSDPIFKKLYTNSLDSINLYIDKTLKEKKWGTNWKKELAKKVKEFGSEDGYKEHLLLQEDIPGNIMSLLKQEIIDKYQVNYLFYSNRDIKNFVDNFLNAIKKSDFNISTWYNNSENETKKANRALIEAYNEYIKNEKDLKSNLETVSRQHPAKIAYHRGDDNKPIESEYPIEGLVSQQQKYFVETWYNNEKPLYLSEVSFKYDADNHNGLDNGISLEKNFSNNPGKNIENITKFLSEIKTKSFDILASEYSDGEEKSNYGEIKELLTLTSTNTKFNPVMKNAVYSLALGLATKTETTDAKELIKLLGQNRNSADGDGKIKFKFIELKDKERAVIFADKDRIRLIRINGLDKLNDGYKSDAESDDKFEKELNLNITSNDNRRLSKTPYLKYLFDNYKNLNLSGKRGIDVLDQVKKYTDNSKEKIDSNSGWWFWFWNYMQRKTNASNWYKKYISNFNSLDSTWKEIIKSRHNSLFSSLAPGNFNTFTESLSKENIEIITNLKSDGNEKDAKATIDIDKIRRSFLDKNMIKWTIKPKSEAI